MAATSSLRPEPFVPRTAGTGGAVLALLLLLTACSSPGEEDHATPTAAGSDEAMTIVISEFSYQVPDTVPPGASVTVRNEDDVGHTVTSDEPEIFDVPVGPGEEVTLTTPDEPGQYPFHCIPHPQMTGTLVVG
ncbi:cupredoxin domain-containing protein [Ruania zhangjianzhongii]|uniref:cupredoxin domain-containing protein n=1 Tax=Ruania zhangjianzhongii TaxID=2603206 RepID=UPI00143CC6CF|nr:cupredoxin domain-containing protein [Ruania zhangjianzhongii]